MCLYRFDRKISLVQFGVYFQVCGKSMIKTLNTAILIYITDINQNYIKIESADFCFIYSDFQFKRVGAGCWSMKTVQLKS